MQISHLILYGTSACHLCEQAEALMQEVSLAYISLHNMPLKWQVVDIVDDEALMERYGLTIPVLSMERNGALSTLNWSFTQSDILNFLAS